MNSRRLIVAPRIGQQIVATFAFAQEEAYVRFGSKAVMCSARAMSASLPKADMSGATTDVRYGPIADIQACPL